MAVTRAGLFGAVAAYLVFAPKTPMVQPSAEHVRATVTISQGNAVVSPSRWSPSGTLPASVAKHTILEFNESLWVFAGRKVFASDDLGASWAEVGTNALPDDYAEHMACVFGGKMWIIGGLGSGTPTDLIYTSTDGLTWVQPTHLTGHFLTPSKLPIHGAGCVSTADAIYVVGGKTTGGVPSRKVFRSFFSIPTDTGPFWIEVGTDALPIALARAGVVQLADGTVVACGGVTLSGDSRKVFASADVAVWTEVGTDALPIALEPGNSITVQDDQIWLIGGSANGVNLATAYTSIDGGATWQSSTSLPDSLSFGAAITANGSVLVSGGLAGDGFDQAATVYRFAPAAPAAGMRATVAITPRITSTEER